MTGKINLLNKLWGAFLVCLISCSCGSLDYENDPLLGEARRIILEGYSSNRPEVRLQSVRMMKVLPPEDTLPLLEMFWSPGEMAFYRVPSSPDFKFLYKEVLAVQYALAPEETLAFIHKKAEFFLSYMDLYELFSLIGFDKVNDFDNLFYYLDLGPTRKAGFMWALILLEQYSQQKDELRRKLLTFFPGYTAPGDTPGEGDVLLDRYRQLGLHPGKLVAMLKARGGIADTVVRDGRVYRESGEMYENIFSTSFTLENLLYQVVLYKQGYLPELYVKEYFTSYPAKDPSTGAWFLKETRHYMDLRKVPGTPSFLINHALASLYGGEASGEHLAVIVENFTRFPLARQVELMKIILESPPGEVRSALIHLFLDSPDRTLRLLAWKGVETPGELSRSLEELGKEEKDPRILEILFRLMAADPEAGKRLPEYFHHSPEYLRVTAAGYYITFRKGIKK